MATETPEAGKSGRSKSDRFYQNPMLRDQEWERAKQAPWWLMALAVAIVVAAFFVGVYSAAPQNIIGWVVGVVTIAIYLGLGSVRRQRARRRLREIHGQTAA